MNRAPARVVLPSVTAVLAGLLVFSPARADAQITVPSTTLPAAGDTLKLSVDTAPVACSFQSIFTPPGGGQTWDLNCLNADTTQDIVYRPAAQGSVSASVPGATMVATIPPSGVSSTFPGTSLPTEDYYDVSGGALRLVASYGRPFNLSFDSIFRLSPPLPQRSTPLNFFDIRQAASNVLQAYPASAVPGILSLAPTADSIRYRVTLQELKVVDAWGRMTIPGGSYDVLREKATRYRSTAVDVKVAPLGWIDISTIGGQNSQVFGAFLGTDTLTYHSYYTNVGKEPIAVIEMNTAQNAFVKVAFKNVAPVCARDGDPCGDQSSSACNLPDSCLAGVCVANLVPAGTACGAPGTACTNADACNGAGACVASAKPNGTLCSDGSACTTLDSCQNGACLGGPPLNCNDGNACTIDSCNPATGCVSSPDPVCMPPISVLSAVQQVESCAPANGVLDPDERVTYAVTLRNNGSQATTNLMATLLASAGVIAPSQAQSYGVIPPGGSATRSFTWTGVGACGAAWSAAFALADGAQTVPGVTVAGTYGTPGGVCNTGCAVARVATATTLARNTDGSVRATVTVSNTGSVQANNVVLTSALLGAGSGTPLPQTVTSVPPGGSRTVTVTFPSSVPVGANVLKLTGTYTGGTFSSSLRVNVP